MSLMSARAGQACIAALCGLAMLSASPAVAAEGASVPEPPRRPAGDVVARCGGSTLFAEPLAARDKFRFTARHSPARFDRLLDEGCLQVARGCNSCSVQYRNCESLDAIKACRDGTCLARVCERRVICTAKRCTAEGRRIDCDARLARQQCLQPLRSVRPAARGSVGQ